MSKWLFIAMVIGLAGAVSAADAADGGHVYKWTDVNGVVHYSDRPPATDHPHRYLFSLPELPPPDPKQIAAIQARIAAINAMLTRIQTRNEQEQRQQQVNREIQQPTPEKTVIERVVNAVPVYYGNYGHRRFHRNRYRDHDDFKQRHRSKPASSSRPDWPFPYNLNNNSSFPEEMHFPSGH